jgi:hypothetical protein
VTVDDVTASVSYSKNFQNGDTGVGAFISYDFENNFGADSSSIGLSVSGLTAVLYEDKTVLITFKKTW